MYILSSRRASAQAVTSKWQLRTTNPMNTNSSVGENWFLAEKRVMAGPFMNQSEKFQRVKRPKFRWRRSRRFGFSHRWPETGRFGRFSGPKGPKWDIHFWTLTQKERRAGRARCTQATLFPYDCGGLRAKTRFEPVSGAHGPKRVSGNGQKRPSATG